MLAETALHEDLDDEDNILRVASAIEDVRLLAPLHLLTAADSAATGQARWTPWTAALVGTLVSRLDRALSPDVDGAGLAARGESVRELVLSTMRTQRPGELEFVAAAPLRYLASREAAEVERDARLVAELAMAPSAIHALMAVSPGPVSGTHTVTVAAEDRPELLSRIAGAMSLSGLDILSVDAYGTDNRIALDTFLVSSATKRAVTTETFVTLERLLLAALRDRLGLATRLAERSKHYPSSAQGPKEVRIEQVGWTTALHLPAPDRQGLLHDIARAVSANGLDIRWARIQTIEGVAVDTFHLGGADGGPVHDPGTLGHVAMGVRAIL
jgi:[protein-PII] uridylyltransferase